MSAVELRVPSGLNAADAVNRMGINAKITAPMATMWRQPTRRTSSVQSSVDLLEGRGPPESDDRDAATITKMSTDTAAANPYWAPPSAKASR